MAGVPACVRAALTQTPPSPSPWSQVDLTQLIQDAINNNGTITVPPGFDPDLLALIRAAVNRILGSSTRVNAPPVPPARIEAIFWPPGSKQGGGIGGRRRLRQQHGR